MNTKNVLLGIFISLTVLACKKEETPTPTPIVKYSVPTTYNFINPDTASAKQCLNMLAEITAYIRTTHSATSAPVLDAQKLKDMYLNVNNPFSSSVLNSSGIILKNETAMDFQAAVIANFEDAVLASQNAGTNPTASTAYSGYAGKLINGSRYILVDTAGFEYKEFIEKGLMGAVFYYQAMKNLNNIGSFDNTVITNGTTAQERAWDEAFAFFGVPSDFPTNIKGLKNWGTYCNTVSNSLAGNSNNEPSSLNSIVMKAWLQGRAAISNKDNIVRDASRNTVVASWEKVAACRFISYLKSAKANISAPATFHHNLSEAVGFAGNFKYNTSKKITDAELEEILSLFKTSGSINLYKVTSGNLDIAINKMASIFNLDASLL